jgi:hypothetical protein
MENMVGNGKKLSPKSKVRKYEEDPAIDFCCFLLFI